MGFESVLSAPQLTLAQWQKALNCFEEKGQFEVIERAVGEHPTVAYAFESVRRKTWPADFIVAMQLPGVYLLFHSATIPQQVIVTTLLTDCLRKTGITGAFEEC